MGDDMDINFKAEGYTFNFRVAAIIRSGNKILLEKNKQVNYYGLIGGRCKIGEDSISAIKREILEETGEETEYVRSIGILENFFISRYTKIHYHEILIIHELRFKNPYIYHQDNLINLEEKKDAQFTWKNLNELDKYEPQIVFKHLNDPTFFHLINKDKTKFE